MAIYTGFLVALSSTAVVLTLLSDRRETNAPHGQVGLGLLLFQDLAVVLMVQLVPMLAGAGGGPAGIAWALAKAAGIVALVLVGARRLMPKILEAVARTCAPEIFLLKALAAGLSARALGYSWGTAVFSGLFRAQMSELSFVLERAGSGVGLSPAGLGETGTQTFIAATVLSMIATPFLAQGGAALNGWLGRRAKREQKANGPAAPAGDGAAAEAAADGLSDHVIIAGYGAGERRLAAALQEVEVPYFILTPSPEGARGAGMERARFIRLAKLDLGPA